VRYPEPGEIRRPSGTTYRIAVDGYFGQQGPIELSLAPANQFRFGKVDRDEELGTAELVVNVPNPGDLTLARTERVRGAAASAEAAGEVRLTVSPRGEAKTALRERGSVRVKATVTYTPEGGEPSTQAKWAKLIKRG
jgi:hypothetical protein